MNTLNKITNLQKQVRDLDAIIMSLSIQLSDTRMNQEKTKDRVNDLEEILVSKLQCIFEGEKSPLYDMECRLKELEK